MNETERKPRAIIACEVMRSELEALELSRRGEIEFEFLEQNLHRVPDQIGRIVQDAIDKAARRAVGPIVLGYGLCSNGTLGLKAPEQGLVIPLVHDCIALFMGSREAYKRAFEARCGTYYLTAGWIEAAKDPLGMLEEEYVPRVGRETAEWALHEELKHYTHIALIDTGVGNIEALRARARENADFLGKKLEEVPGRPDLFEKMLLGPPYDNSDFLVLGAGQVVTQEAFLES